MLHKNIRTLTWFNFFTDFKLYAPIAIIYFSQVSGSFAWGMAVFSIVTIVSAAFELPTGIFSDFVGRRKTVIYGSISAVLYSILYAIGQSFWILALGAVFEGISRSFYSGNNDALLHGTLSQYKQEDQYEEFLGRVSAMFQVALAVSAILGSLLASWSFPTIMWLSVIPQVVCVFLAFKLIEPKVMIEGSSNIYTHLSAAYTKFLSNKKLRLLSVASIANYALGESAYQFQAAFYNTVWPLWAIGIAKTLSNLGAAASFHFSGRILRKVSAIKILMLNTLYGRVANTIALLFPSSLSPVLMATTSLLFGVSRVAENSLLQKQFSDQQRATMGSLNAFAGSIVFGVVAVGLGYIADRLSPVQAFLGIQFFQFLTIFIYIKLFSNVSIKLFSMNCCTNGE